MFTVEGLPDWKLAYIAGIIDGEGCISLSKEKKTGYFIPSIFVGMCDSMCINILHMYTGLGSLSHRAPSHWGNKHVYIWQVRNRLEIYLLLKAVHPYLITKRKQADVLLEFVERRISGRLQCGYDDELQGKLKALNR